MISVDKINRHYFGRTRRICAILQMVPFLRCLILNGSLAQGKARPDSDIDILVIGRDGRIFTARFFILLLSTLLGVKRSSDDAKSHAGKFCFNYFMTTSYLKIPAGRGTAMDRYCAENYSKSVLVWGDKKTFRRFFEENERLFALAQKSKDKDQNHGLKIGMNEICANILRTNLKRVRSSRLIGFTSNNTSRYKPHQDFPIYTTMVRLIGIFGEMMLGGRFGDWVERILKKIQIRRIERDPRTARHPNLIVYNDQELLFHPPGRSPGRSIDSQR
ncbi:MAG: nucleotidyltransferase domain-containing protein [Patescibacteria group bacterium]